MLIAKYVACMYVYQHVRQKMHRESSYSLDVSAKFDSQLTFRNLAHLLRAHITNAKLREDYHIRKCWKCNKQSMHKHNAIIL